MRLFKSYLDGSDNLDTDDFCNIGVGLVMIAIGLCLLGLAARIWGVIG